MILGVYSERTNTAPVLICRGILEELEIRYQQEFLFGPFSLDFSLLDYEGAIEVQGDFWHANPVKYFNKKLCPAQARNVERDARKRQYLRDCGLKLLEVWEYDLTHKLEECRERIKSWVSSLPRK